MAKRQTCTRTGVLKSFDLKTQVFSRLIPLLNIHCSEVVILHVDCVVCSVQRDTAVVNKLDQISLQPNGQQFVTNEQLFLSSFLRHTLVSCPSLFSLFFLENRHLRTNTQEKRFVVLLRCFPFALSLLSPR